MQLAHFRALVALAKNNWAQVVPSAAAGVNAVGPF